MNNGVLTVPVNPPVEVNTDKKKSEGDSPTVVVKKKKPVSTRK